MKYRNLKFLQNDMETWITNTSHQENHRHATQIRQEIQTTETLSAEQRVEIYRNMYWVRMLDAMMEDFPATASCMGHEVFHDLASSYIQNYPSQSFTMRLVNARFSEFLKMQAPEMPHAEGWGELAEFEWALNTAFHAPLIDAKALAATTQKSGTDFLNLALKPSPSFATLTTQHEVTPLLQAYIADEDCTYAVPEVGEERIVIYRNGSRSLYQVLDETTWKFLGLLLGGNTIEIALDQIASELTADAECATLLSFLKSWISEGVLTIA